MLTTDGNHTRNSPYPDFLSQHLPSLPLHSILSMIHSFLLINRQGKCRLQRWYSTNDNVFSASKRSKLIREIGYTITSRHPKLTNILPFKGYKLIYKRYASLFFACLIGADDNELIVFELIHSFVEILDTYFRNVCELDLIYNFHKAYSILDEMIIAGEISASSKKAVLQSIQQQDSVPFNILTLVAVWCHRRIIKDYLIDLSFLCPYWSF